MGLSLRVVRRVGAFQGSTLATGVTSTTTTLHAEELKWGETATVGDGTVTVDAPVVDPAAESSQPGFIVVDEPVLVWLLVPWSKQIRLNWR